MLSLEILSKNGTILRAYNGDKVILPNVDILVDDYNKIVFTGEQVWLCRIMPKGEIKPMMLCGFIYKLKDRKE